MDPLISSGQSAGDQEGTGLIDLAIPLVRHSRLLILGPLAAGSIVLALSFLVKPTFTATTTFLPPQQQQSSAASALASLGALSGLAGAAAGGIRSPGDQYVSLLQSATVANRLIDDFKLMEVYDDKYRFQARLHLAQHVRIWLGKKDGLITVEVDDTDPQRAADLANRHVDELRRLTSTLALTEAQQRRVFFEAQLKKTRERLDSAQKSLQQSGFNAGALRADPKSVAEAYARLKAEITSAEVRLQTLRLGLSDNAPDVKQQQTLLVALRAQLARLEERSDTLTDGDYLGKYRDFKYQETLFDIFSRQYESARLDESREGALIQVVDSATKPEWKSKPKRAFIAAGTTAATAVILIVFLLTRHAWRLAAVNPRMRENLSRLQSAWRGS
jgi:uncharacterized protein involved in exopolysaccharide biosynthesis